MDKGNKLNVICVQINPIPKKVEENISKAEKLLEKYYNDNNTNSKIDVVVFPEMAFTGYIFKDKNDVECCLEEKGKGITFDFCSKLAKR